MHLGSWNVSEWYAFFGVLAIVGGAVVAVWRREAPKFRAFWERVNGALDAIAGREEYEDPASGRKVPALPPLTTRVALVEEAVVMMAKTDKRVDALEVRVEKLEDTRLDRRLTQIESAQMYRALADGDPDLIPPELIDAPDEPPTPKTDTDS